MFKFLIVLLISAIQVTSASPIYKSLTDLTSGRNAFTVEVGSQLYISSASSSTSLNNIFIETGSKNTSALTLSQNYSPSPIKTGLLLTNAQLVVHNLNPVNVSTKGFLYVTTASQAANIIVVDNVKIINLSPALTTVNTTIVVFNPQSTTSNMPLNVADVTYTTDDVSSTATFGTGVPGSGEQTFFQNPIKMLTTKGYVTQFFNSPERFQVSIPVFHVKFTGGYKLTVQPGKNALTTTTSRTTTGLLSILDGFNLNTHLNFLKPDSETGLTYLNYLGSFNSTININLVSQTSSVNDKLNAAVLSDGNYYNNFLFDSINVDVPSSNVGYLLIQYVIVENGAVTNAPATNQPPVTPHVVLTTTRSSSDGLPYSLAVFSIMAIFCNYLL